MKRRHFLIAGATATVAALGAPLFRSAWPPPQEIPMVAFP